MDKQVFITYSWDTAEHKEWVRKLADKLIDNGVAVLLDQYDILPGESFTHFMESAIAKSDKVLVILTPNYKEKSMERKGGVGYEQQIISGEIISGIERKKFIPLIRQGKYEEGADCAVPSHFKGISILDFRSSENEQEFLEQLLRTIYEEPKLVKPPIGKKTEFKKKILSQSFVIELDENFNYTQSEIRLTDIFLQVADLRKSNSAYNLSFNIKDISDQHIEYLRLVEIQNPSDKEIERKLQLRNYLNQTFYFPNGTLYDYLNYSINSIIDFSFNKYKYIFNFQELFISLTKCFLLFSDRNAWRNGTTKFDIFQDKIKWGFSIWISENEVEGLLSKFSTKDKMFLTAIAGLDVYDLSHSTLIEEIIPKEAYQFTIDFFQKRVNDNLREECLKIGNFRIGLG